MHDREKKEPLDAVFQEEGKEIERESARTKGDRWRFGIAENGVAHSRRKRMPVLNFMAVLVP